MWLSWRELGTWVILPKTGQICDLGDEISNLIYWNQNGIFHKLDIYIIWLSSQKIKNVFLSLILWQEEAGGVGVTRVSQDTK